jgi:hypothetical protein
MLRFVTILTALLFFVTPAAGQSCPETAVDLLWQDLADSLGAAGTAAGPSSGSSFEDRRIDGAIETVDFELRTMFDLVDIGHVKTAEVIGEAVFAELELLRETTGMSDEEWAVLEGLFEELFDRGKLGDPKGTRERAAALMAELEGHARGELKLGENFWE